MPKLPWVLLPLLAVAARLAWHRLRGRRPSRHALNIGFSLLLALHLGFNFRIVRCFFVRARSAAPATVAAAVSATAAPRRRWLGWAGALGAVAAAYMLGLRHGRQAAPTVAGCIGERFYLEAGMRGLAVCAVGAFHDDEATALVVADAAREWIVHFAAIGVPAG